MKKRDAIIILLLLLLIFFVGFYFLNSGDQNSVEIDNDEKIENPQEPNSNRGNENGATSNYDDSIVGDEEVGEEKSLNEEEDNELNEESNDEADNESLQGKRDIKFGLNLSQRSELWSKYQKRQDEIIAEAEKINDDRFSKPYLNHVNSEIKKLKGQLINEYNLKAIELDFILNEGKNGKFNKMIQTF